ncbi:glycosyltransferase family 9 protein [Rodentibacter haemolyticus]|uniref:Glycosyltransferase family 9 protein n=1 Tax=Rodentibacter haemolyticus TaxID=2778911 RepID=A0ABX6UXD5_9PAST|nr:glycosyltransferase family 9 protein [Rodentibacter haemolyticus]QPB41861.1 glycosyltransferase family 9 protein [Rodentibacter haemolyticus]
MNFKSKLREIRIKLGKFFLDRKISQNLTTLEPQKILFLRQDGKIGDYIVSSFIFREIKKYNSNIQIGIICTRQNSYLFEQNPYIDELYLVKKRSIVDCIRQGLKLRQENYDVVIDPTLSIRNRDLLLLRLVKAKIYVGYQKQQYKLFNYNIDEEYIHFSTIYRLVLEKINIPCQDNSYDIPCNKKAENKIKRFLQSNNIKDYIALNFFGAGKNRKFSDENILNWIEYICHNSHLPIILLSYPAVTEKLNVTIKALDNVFLLENTENIFDNIELIRLSNLVISPDTSIVHIASGLNKPMIALYSNDEVNFSHWHPNSKNLLYLLRYELNINEIVPNKIEKSWLNLK